MLPTPDPLTVPVHVRRRLRAAALATQIARGDARQAQRADRPVWLVPGLAPRVSEVLHERALARQAREWMLARAKLVGRRRELLAWSGCVSTERRWSLPERALGLALEAA